MGLTTVKRYCAACEFFFDAMQENRGQITVPVSIQTMTTIMIREYGEFKMTDNSHLLLIFLVAICLCRFLLSLL